MIAIFFYNRYITSSVAVALPFLISRLVLSPFEVKLLRLFYEQ